VDDTRRRNERGESSTGDAAFGEVEKSFVTFLFRCGLLGSTGRISEGGKKLRVKNDPGQKEAMTRRRSYLRRGKNCRKHENAAGGGKERGKGIKEENVTDNRTRGRENLVHGLAARGDHREDRI